MLSTRLLRVGRCFSLLLKRTKELPISEDALLGRLESAPSFQQSLKFLEERETEFAAIRRRTFQTLANCVNKIQKGGQKGPWEVELLLQLIPKFKGWCENPSDKIELYYLISVLQKKNPGVRNKQMKELVKHALELRGNIVEYLLSPQCTDCQLIARFICASASIKSFSYEVFEKLRALPFGLSNYTIVAMLKAFCSLQPRQRRNIYSFCYRLCSNIQIQPLGDLTKSDVYRSLCELNLQKNSIYKRGVSVLDDIVETLPSSKIPHPKCMVNYIKGSQLRHSWEPRMVLQLDPQHKYSPDVCRTILLAKNIDFRASNAKWEQIRTIAWKSFTQASIVPIPCLHKTLMIFGEEASQTFEKKLEQHRYFFADSLELLRNVGKVTNLQNIMKSCLEKLMVEGNEHHFQFLPLLVAYDFYQKHISQYPEQRLPEELEARVQARCRAHVKLFEQQINKNDWGERKKYFTLVPYNPSKFFQEIDATMVAAFHRCNFSFIDRLDTQLRMKDPARMEVLGELTADKSFKLFKTLYACLQVYTPELFVRVWERVCNRMSTADKIFCLTCTDRATAASQLVWDQLGKQSLLHSRLDLHQQRISVRSLAIAYEYGDCPLISCSDILDAIERNITQLGYLLKLNVESKVELLEFYLTKTAKQKRVLPSTIIEPIKFALESIVNTKFMEENNSPWMVRVILRIVLKAHSHEQLPPFSVEFRTTVQNIMSSISMGLLSTKAVNRRQLYSALWLLELIELGYKSPRQAQLLQFLKDYQGQPITYTCQHRHHLPTLFSKISGARVQLL